MKLIIMPLPSSKSDSESLKNSQSVMINFWLWPREFLFVMGRPPCREDRSIMWQVTVLVCVKRCLHMYICLVSYKYWTSVLPKIIHRI